MNRLSAYKKLSPKDLVKKLEADNKFHATIPIDVEELAKSLGIKITEELDWENSRTIGSARIDENNAPEIYINALNSDYEPRKRFTIAHEIGHLILHLNQADDSIADDSRSFNRTDTYWDSQEYEANNFAAQLLMPLSQIKVMAKEIISSYQEGNQDKKIPKDLFVDLMANKFQVSKPAMKYRLKNLGILKQ